MLCLQTYFKNVAELFCRKTNDYKMTEMAQMVHNFLFNRWKRCFIFYFFFCSSVDSGKGWINVSFKAQIVVTDKNEL